MADVTVSEDVDSFMRSATASAARDTLGASSGVWPKSLGGTGYASKPTIVRYHSADQVVPTGHGTRTVVAFDTAVSADGITWDAVNHQATVPRAGIVLVTYIHYAEGADWTLLLVRSGTDFRFAANGSNWGFAAPTMQLDVSAGDTLRIELTHASGSDRTIFGGASKRLIITYVD